MREGFTVEEILIEGDTVIGMRGKDRERKSFTERARIVIGAEGNNSMVATAGKALEYNQRDSKVCTFYAYWKDVKLCDGFQLEFYPRSYRGIYAWPTNDGLLLIGGNWKVSEFERVRKDPESHFIEVLDQCATDLATRVRKGKRVGEFVGGYARNVFRRPYGNGWALVGDAGACYEFTSAQGITNAFRQAAQIAEAIHQGLAGDRRMDDALSEFEKQRNEIEGAFYDFTYQQATLEPPAAETLELMRAIHKSQDATDAFLGLFAQTTNPAEFFSPANLGKLTGTS